MDMQLLWGQGEDLDIVQMAVRGLVIFLVCYLSAASGSSVRNLLLTM